MEIDEIYISVFYDRESRKFRDADTNGEYNTGSHADMEDLAITLNWLYGQLVEAKRGGFQPRYEIYKKMKHGM